MKKHAHTSPPFAAQAPRSRTYALHGTNQECAGRGVRISHTSRACWTSAIKVRGSTTRPPSQTTCLWLGPPAIVITFPRAPPHRTHEAPPQSLPSRLEMPPGSQVQLLRVTPHASYARPTRGLFFFSSLLITFNSTHRPPPLLCRHVCLLIQHSNLSALKLMPWQVVDGQPLPQRALAPPLPASPPLP